MFGIKTRILKVIRNNFVNSIVNNDKIIDLMTSFKADEYGHQCSAKDADLGYGWIHYGLLRQHKPKRVLCIGSRYGYIPAICAQACKDNNFGKVDFVDAGFDSETGNDWTGVGYWKTKNGTKCFNNFRLEKYIDLHVMATKDYAKNNSYKSYDYIYIDGDHSLKGVVLDFSLFFPLLNKGGYIVFHDVSVKGERPEGIYGVWKLWQKIEEKFGGIKVDFLGSGLGIIKK